MFYLKRQQEYVYTDRSGECQQNIREKMAGAKTICLARNAYKFGTLR